MGQWRDVVTSTVTTQTAHRWQSSLSSFSPSRYRRWVRSANISQNYLRQKPDNYDVTNRDWLCQWLMLFCSTWRYHLHNLIILWIILYLSLFPSGCPSSAKYQLVNWKTFACKIAKMCGFTNCKQETRAQYWAVLDKTGFLNQTSNTWQPGNHITWPSASHVMPG